MLFVNIRKKNWHKESDMEEGVSDRNISKRLSVYSCQYDKCVNVYT